MRLLVCTIDVDPCPAVSMASIAFADMVDFASMGITGANVLYVFGWGFAMVIFAWKFAYGVSLAKSLIDKL